MHLSRVVIPKLNPQIAQSELGSSSPGYVSGPRQRQSSFKPLTPLSPIAAGPPELPEPPRQPERGHTVASLHGAAHGGACYRAPPRGGLTRAVVRDPSARPPQPRRARSKTPRMRAQLALLRRSRPTVQLQTRGWFRASRSEV